MSKSILILIALILSNTFLSAQNCTCIDNYKWVKKTFEENDAGFQYALASKGEQAYADHNDRIEEKVKSVKTITDCTPILYEWLKFFRSGHIGIRLKENVAPVEVKKTETKFPDWESYDIKTEDFITYLDSEKLIDYEGIWETPPYKIGIKYQGDGYIGFILESGAETWSKGQIKLKFNIGENKTSGVYFMRDHSAVEVKEVTLIGNNHLKIGNFTLKRIYPEIEDQPKFAQYFNALNAQYPYIEQMNQTTLYLRVPSFNESYKRQIDSVLNANKEKLLTTANLIIDIRNNGGGSDAAYSEIIPFLYTNPIRGVGVEFLSTKLNNQRMLDFIHKPEYEFDDDGKKWAKESYDKLERNLGQFVNLNENIVSVNILDTVYPFPQNVGIIINEGNGSTSEQFLLEAKQSKKVKLFGVTTFGVLDISNMYFVESPCNEFQFGYSLSRSMRIPDFTIDEKGIQPDFYLDKSVPPYEWTEFVNKVLNGE